MDDKDNAILRILLSKRRSLSSKRITEILNENGIIISRPTVAKRLNRLKEIGWVIGKYKFDLKKLPKRYK